VGVDTSLIAEDLFNKKKNKGRPAEKRDFVKDEIQRLLVNGEPMSSAELESEICKLTGCHSNTLAAAKKELGVESYQSGRQWFSVLRSQNTVNSQAK
jgi:hypothetical protein